jgi:hypothetical protein
MTVAWCGSPPCSRLPGQKPAAFKAQHTLRRHTARLDAEHTAGRQRLAHDREHAAFALAVQHKGLAHGLQHVSRHQHGFDLVFVEQQELRVSRHEAAPVQLGELAVGEFVRCLCAAFCHLEILSIIGLFVKQHPSPPRRKTHARQPARPL